MSFTSELKRRKVVRVAIVYAATAFVVLQAADLLTAGLALPGWLLPSVTVLAILGFPFALVFAWAFDLTPAGVQRTDPATGGPLQERWLSHRTIVVVASLVAVLAVTGWLLRPMVARRMATRVMTSPIDHGIVFATLEPPPGEQWGGAGSDFALSPDGRRVAITTREAGEVGELVLRSLDQLQTVRLPGTRGASYPFWSPDGKSLGFFSAGHLRTLEIASGSVRAHCPAPSPEGGSWGKGGAIIYIPEPRGDLHRSGNGAECKPIHFRGDSIPLPGSRLRRPYFLPDGKRFVFGAASQVWMGHFDDERLTRVRGVTVGSSVFAPPHYLLLFLAPGDPATYAQRLDLSSGKLLGEPRRILDRVESPGGRTSLSVSGNGVLVAKGPRSGASGRMLWVRRGASTLTDSLEVEGNGWTHRWSHDERRVALGGWAIRVYDVDRRVMTRLTHESTERHTEIHPVWSPLDTVIAFARASVVAGRPALTLLDTRDGKTRTIFQPESALRSELIPTDWSADGRYLSFALGAGGESAHSEAWVFDFAAGTARKLFPESGDVREVRTSPDGKWVAYQSNIDGDDQIYLREIAGDRTSLRVSTTGGRFPSWRADGAELFYARGDRTLMAVSIVAGKEPRVSAPRAVVSSAVLSGMALAGFEPSRDGQLFQVSVNREVPGLTLVIDWWRLLNQKAN